MAWLESAVVYYLRTYIHRLEPYQPNPLPVVGGFGPVEGIREAATMIMLLTVGMLAGKNWRARIGYSAIAFGVWDIFYYVFLKAIWRLAALARGLGHSISAAAAVVGAGVGADGHRLADDYLGNARQ